MLFLVCLGLVLLAWWRFDRTRPREQRATSGAPAAPPPTRHPVAAASALATAYAIFCGWMFVAWYRKKEEREFKWGGDGWMGEETYAGGADKLGHWWATMALARLGTVLLVQWGGFARRNASLASAALSELLFTGVEVRDGFIYEFSFSDLTGDSIGAVLAALFDNFPRLNELFGFRVDYWPSEMYTRKVAGTSPCPARSCSRWNVAEDYSGQTYLAAFHAGAVRAIRDKIGPASRFVDVVGGFDSRNYRPLPDHDITELPRQRVFLGLALNAQGVVDTLLEDRPSPAARAAQKIGHGAFEVFQLPRAVLPLVSTSRTGPMRYASPRRAPATKIRRRRALAPARRAPTAR